MSDLLFVNHPRMPYIRMNEEIVVINGMTLHVVYWRKPTDRRDLDWQAMRCDNREPTGNGKTMADAIADLMKKLEAI